MLTRLTRFLLAFALLLTAAPVAFGQTKRILLDKPAVVTPGSSRVEAAEYRGRRALKMTADPKVPGSDDVLALVKDVTFRDGTLEIDVASTLAPGASEGARGFIGLAFRVADGGTRFEKIYLRPTNGRADDQVRRNHSAQYTSFPDYPWPRLRKEFPEKYESYVDLELGAWTRMKIVVSGTTARLFVHGAEQPCLVVTDLKMGAAEGGIGLSIGPGTEGYFTDLRITPGGAKGSSRN